MLFHTVCISNRRRHLATEVKICQRLKQQSCILSILPMVKGIHLQGAEMPEKTWFRKHMMPVCELEKLLACWLWKDDCRRRTGTERMRFGTRSPACFWWNVSIGIFTYLPRYKMDRQEVICKPYVISSPAKKCILGGLLYPHSTPPCRHASASLSLHNSSLDLLQDHLPPLVCICSFSACQTSSEFKSCKR